MENLSGCFTMPWMTSWCLSGSMSGTPAWCRSKNKPLGVTMPSWCWSGVMLQSDQFCLLTNTSVRLRLTCASNFDGIPYAVGSMMRPISRFDCGISSRCALAAAIPVADAAVAPAKTTPRRRNLRLACDWGALVSTTLSVADPPRDLGPRATSVFCMTVSSRFSRHCLLSCSRNAASWRPLATGSARRNVALARLLLPASAPPSLSLANKNRQTNSAYVAREQDYYHLAKREAGACWRNQYSSEFVATYDKEQARQHGIRRSMPPMAPFPQSVFQ